MRLIWERQGQCLWRCRWPCRYRGETSTSSSSFSPIVIPWDSHTQNPMFTSFSDASEQVEMNVGAMNDIMVEEEEESSSISHNSSQHTYQNLLQEQPPKGKGGGGGAITIPDSIQNECDEEEIHCITTSLRDIDQDENDNLPSPYLLSHKEHITMALQIAPMWFVSNYFYNLSLIYTSITSSTVLSSTGSVFTFLFAVCWGEETFSRWKVLGVGLAFGGSVLTSLHDASSMMSNGGASGASGDNDMSGKELWGDIAGVLSALGYGGYCVMIRVLCPKDENQMSMQLLLGYIGFFNMVVFGPFAIWKFLTINDGSSSIVDESAAPYSMRSISETSSYYYSSLLTEDLPQQHLTWFIFGCLVVKGLFDNVISDYLWARAIILTSATVATVGLGLTVPLALISDVFIMKRDDVLSRDGIVGALMVVAGFVSVNVGEI